MNKMIMLVGLLIAIMSVSAFGAGFLGPPTAELEKGQWKVGYNYTYIDMDLEETKTKGKIFGDVETQNLLRDLLENVNINVPMTFRDKFKIEDVKTQRHYATIGYGVEDWWEVYLQLGFADVKMKTKSEDENVWDSYNFDSDFAWGLGTRITFYEQNNIRWGTSVQMNWLDTSYDDKKSWGAETVGAENWSDLTWKEQLDLETYDLLIAVGPTVDMGGWKLYGGPFYYYLSGDIDIKGNITGTLLGTLYTAGVEQSGDLKADSNFGGFVGAQFPLTGNCDMTTELSFTGDALALGFGIGWKF